MKFFVVNTVRRMVKCPVCGKKFDRHIDFYRHWDENHVETPEEKDKYGLKAAIFPRPEHDKLIYDPDLWDREYMERYGVMVEMRVEPDRIVVLYMPNIHQRRWGIAVWNCRGTVFCPHTHRDDEYRWVGYFFVPPCIQGGDEEVEDFLFRILDDHGGAINMGGTYLFDDDHIEELKRRFLAPGYEL